MPNEERDAVGSSPMPGEGAPVVLLTCSGPQHRYVARRLWEVLGDRLAAVIVAEPAPEPIWTKLQRGWRRYSFPEVVSRIHWYAWSRAHRVGRHVDSTLHRILFPDGEPRPLPDEIVHTVPDHNGEACLRLLRSIAPRVLAVYGTDLIRRPVIELAGEVALNLHTGISPRYRGASSVFWALHNEEPEWVGSTVHVLDAGVDSGDIVGTAKPKISGDDDVAALFAKCVQVGAELYGHRIQDALEGKLAVEPQDLSVGHQYRFVDRTVTAERRVRRLLRDGLLRRYESHE